MLGCLFPVPCGTLRSLELLFLKIGVGIPAPLCGVEQAISFVYYPFLKNEVKCT
jgi:hypothetical protein